MSLIIDPTNPEPEESQEERQQKEHLAHLSQVETHLQVSNLVKILFTINYDILALLVASSPEQLQETPHYKVLRATLDYYSNLANVSQPAPAAE